MMAVARFLPLWQNNAMPARTKFKKNNDQTLGPIIDLWIKKRGTSRAKVAASLEVSQSQLSRWFSGDRGQHGMPHAVLDAIADYLDVPRAILTSTTPAEFDKMWALWQRANSNTREDIVRFTEFALDKQEEFARPLRPPEKTSQPQATALVKRKKAG